MIAISPAATQKIDPDAELMLRAGRDDRAAFEQLVDRYYGRVLFVIEHLMGNDGQSADLAQDVFLRVYRARKSYRPQSKFSTWLFVIVNNVVRNAKRSLARRREVSVGESNRLPDLMAERTLSDDRFPSPVDALLCEEVSATVRGAITRLNPRQRKAIVLYHFGGLSYAEIAQSMETTLCAAKALLHRARMSLRGELQQYAGSYARTTVHNRPTLVSPRSEL